MLLLPWKRKKSRKIHRYNFLCSVETTIAKKLYVSSAQAPKEQARAAMHMQTKHRSCTYHCLNRDDATLLVVGIYPFFLSPFCRKLTAINSTLNQFFFPRTASARCVLSLTIVEAPSPLLVFVFFCRA